MQVALINMQKGKKGGLEKLSCYLRNHLEELGCTVSFLHADTFHLPKTRLRRKKAFSSACARFLEKRSFDSVFSLEKVLCNATHLRLGEGLHVRYLQERAKFAPFWKKWQLSCSRFHREVLRIEKKTLESPYLQTIYCNSTMVKKELLSHYAVEESKIHVVHNGVEWKSYETPFSSWQEEKKCLLQKLHLPDAFHFLFVGHGFERKGLLFLLKAFANAKKGAHLSIVGYDKKKAFFINYAKKLGLEKHVRFFGAKSPTPFYQYADCLVIPSLYDPFANVTLEALSMGLSVLSSKGNGGSEILDKEMVLPDIENCDAFTALLKSAMKKPKTPCSAKNIRKSVELYDYAIKLQEITKRLVFS